MVRFAGYRPLLLFFPKDPSEMCVVLNSRRDSRKGAGSQRREACAALLLAGFFIFLGEARVARAEQEPNPGFKILVLVCRWGFVGSRSNSGAPGPHALLVESGTNRVHSGDGDRRAARP